LSPINERIRVAVLDDYVNTVEQLPCRTRLADYELRIYTERFADDAALAAAVGDCAALVLTRERTRITDALLARLPQLRLISQTGGIGPHIDQAACERRGVAVVAGTGSPIAPAELTWALILAAMRRIPQEAAALRAGRWQQSLGRTTHGRTLGVWGLGKIGRLLAGYGKTFGMQVISHGRETTRDQAAKLGIEFVTDAPTLFARSDVLSLHLRLADSTRGIVTPALLAQMKTDALFVNTSRAELVAPGALEAALRAGRPGAAAIDVFESEPVFDPQHPLLTMDNVVATPHIGFVERDSLELYYGTAFDNVRRFFEPQTASA
jgi:D-3-phosphoglycerate dehydrogenase